MEVRFFNIAWDADGEADLPSEVVLNVPADADLDADGADILSDKVGFCVLGFEHEIEISEGVRRAVADALGYEVDHGRIADSVLAHKDTATFLLAAQLAAKEREFDRNGGRGVELADAIDDLRIALAAR